MDWPDDDHELAARLATEAGRLLVELRHQRFAAGDAEWRVKDAGDLGAHRFLMAALAEARPTDAVLSEEGLDDRRRLGAERVWIVDPLDGTNEYGEGRHDWAVHVALVVKGTPVAGAVALPALEQTFCTRPAPVVGERPPGPLRLVASRTRASQATLLLAHHLDAEIVRLGSAGAKTMAVVSGAVDIYAHSGGMYEWDSCAPAAVAAAAGLHVSRIDGSPLEYNNPDPWMPDLLVCRADLAESVLAHL